MAKSRLAKKKVIAALIKCKGFISHTAKSLGCNRQTLYNFLEEFPDMKELQSQCVAERGDDIVLAQYNRAIGTQAVRYMKDGGEVVYDLPPDPAAAKLCLTYDHGYTEKTKTDVDVSPLVVRQIVSDISSLNGDMPDYAKGK